MKLLLLKRMMRCGRNALFICSFLGANKSIAIPHENGEKNKPSRTTKLEVRLNGKITDENSEPIPGASIVIKGTSEGTVSDLNGNYSINAANNNITLIVSFIGYVSQEVAAGGRNTINVQLALSSEQLSEVVVVGYGTQKKKDLTGAMGTIQAKDIVRANPVQAANALQGQVAGVNITRVNSRPGSSFEITIRGSKTLTGH